MKRWQVYVERDALQGRDLLVLISEDPDGTRTGYTLQPYEIGDVVPAPAALAISSDEMRQFCFEFAQAMSQRFPELGNSQDVRSHLKDMRALVFHLTGAPKT